MAIKKRKLTTEKLTLELQFPQFVGYADYFLQTPARIRIRSSFEELTALTVTASCAEGLLVPYEESVEIPFESSVELVAENIFSPVLLAEANEIQRVKVTVSAKHEGKEMASAETEITVLPFDWWEGHSGNTERIATFVRPRARDCSVVLQEAGKRLKKWNESAEYYGYSGTDKNTVRRIIAAIFASIKAADIEHEAEQDLYQPALAVRENSILKDKKATPFQLAVFACACLEAAHVHPVLAVGRSGLGVGVWLYDSCFLDPVTDDGDIVSKYISEGINNLSFFDVEDLFVDSSVAYTPSERHFAQKLAENYFEYFVDIRRCRMGGIAVCPVRGRGLKGYEIYREEDLSAESAPAPLPVFKELKLGGKQPKNKQWERRLLDLTSKNALLNFTGKNALHLAECDPDTIYNVLSEQGSMKLRADGNETAPFGATPTPQKRDLVALEQRKGVLRALTDARSAQETAVKLLRKNREAAEETGAKILYLALGFLKYVSKEDGKPKYAPIVLAPVGLGRAKGNEDFSVIATEEGYFVNATLLEFLKQEFNIDIRGLGGDVSALKLSEIIAMVRAEVITMKGWDVVQDTYLSAFSFQNFLLWNDVRTQIDEFKKNATVAALLSGRSEKGSFPAPKEEDAADPEDVLLPLSADSSQFSAVSLSDTGASFVLHGPPGTGKSQTITNIIANALVKGKRVLFVAEKKAALDVVKKRLDGIGIGDFCLELHSNKTDKAGVLHRLENTLQLAGTQGDAAFGERTRELIALREELKEPMAALHKKRRLGLSVYQAILEYLKNKNAPDILDIESSFYDTLTEQKLSACKSMILTAAAAAKECGGVYNSPFENVNLTAYSQELRDRVCCASEVVITEIKHLKSFLGLFLDFYRQRVSTLTRKKLLAIFDIVQSLAAGK